MISHSTPHTPHPTLHAPGGLSGCVQPVAALTAGQRAAMVALLRTYFDNVTNAGFEADLGEKESAILLTDTTGRVQGFSTLMRLRAEVDGQSIVAFFSGDTIIARDHWGERVLPRLWAQYVFGLAATLTDARPFWFLISSGYKTYRFLPVFFRDFYPTPARPTPPAMQRILDALARQKFGDGYDARTGIVQLPHATPLRPHVADPAERPHDPHAAFFAARNPGHAHGDELACLTEVAVGNLTPAGRRMLGV